MKHFRNSHPDSIDHPNLMAVASSINKALALVGIEPDDVGGVLDEAELTDHPSTIVLRNIVSRALDKVVIRLEETNEANDPDLFALHDKLLMHEDEIDLEIAIQVAKEKCVPAARTLMREAADYIEKGEPLPEPLRDYISDALRKCSVAMTKTGGTDKKAALAAFNLTSVPGKNKFTEAINDRLICMEVQLARLNESKPGGSFETVADKYEYKDTGSVANLLLRCCSNWQIEKQPKEKLQNDIAAHRKILGK